MTATYPLKAIPRLLLTLLALVTAMLLAPPSGANAKTIILTKVTVEKFLDSYPDVKTIAEKEGRDKGAEIGGSSNQLAAVIAAVSDDTVTPKIDAAVQNHGFEDTKQWLSIGRSVAQAYAHIKGGAQKSKAQDKVEKAIRKIEKTSFLSDKKKQKLIDSLRKQAGDVLAEPPAENIAAIKPMIGEIEKVMQ